jgi:hypothetical protein
MAGVWADAEFVTKRKEKKEDEKRVGSSRRLTSVLIF